MLRSTDNAARKTASDLYQEALALDHDERDELLRLLAQGTGRGFATPEIEQAWMEEIERRQRDLKDGKIREIPADEVMRELHDRYC